MKHFLSFSFLVVALVFLFGGVHEVHAAKLYQEVFDSVGGGGQGLSNYDGLFEALTRDAQGNPVPSELILRNVILYGVSVVIWFITAISIIFIVYAGVKVVLDPASDSAVQKQIIVIRDIALGMIVMHSANFLVAGIYADPTSTQTTLVTTGDKINGITQIETVSPYIINFRDATSPILVSEKVVYPLLNYFFTFIAALAILFIIVSTFRIITGQGDPDKVKAARQGMINTAFGLLVIILAQYFVKAVYGFPTSANPKLGPDVAYALSLMMSIANYLLGFLSFIGVLLLIYAGVLIVSSGITADNKKKGIEIAKRTLIGFIILASSYAVISTIIRVAM